jgi:hypothetical protein
MKTASNSSYSSFGPYYHKSSSVKVYQAKPKAAQLEKWDHSGYEQLQNEKPIQSIEKNPEQKTYAKRQKRPDRVLYNARSKHTVVSEETGKPREFTEKLNFSKLDRKDDDRETSMLEDSMISTSTAMSDRLRGSEEDSYIKGDSKTDRTNIVDVIQSPKESEVEICETLFDMVLETQNGTVNIRIFQGEEDYEEVLDQICLAQGFEAKFGLYFKINMLQLISQSLANPEKVNAILDKLLDLNYKLVMYDCGLGVADESIVPYIDSLVHSTNEEL